MCRYLQGLRETGCRKRRLKVPGEAIIIIVTVAIGSCFLAQLPAGHLEAGLELSLLLLRPFSPPTAPSPANPLDGFPFHYVYCLSRLTGAKVPSRVDFCLSSSPRTAWHPGLCWRTCGLFHAVDHLSRANAGFGEGVWKKGSACKADPGLSARHKRDQLLPRFEA